MGLNLATIVRESARSRPDRVALISGAARTRDTCATGEDAGGIKPTNAERRMLCGPLTSTRG